MFRSRRGNLVRRLWKTRLRTATTGGPSTPTGGAAAGEGGAVSTAGCYEYFGISRPVEAGDLSEDEGVVGQASSEDGGSRECGSPALSKSHAFAFLEQLDITQLEALLCAVRTGAEEVTPCVMVSVGVPLPGALEGIPPEVICGQLWRWPTAKLAKLSLRRLPFCEAATMDCSAARRTMDTQGCRGKTGDSFTALTCCNPYHWSILTLPDSCVTSVFYTNLISRCSNKTISGIDDNSFPSESILSVTTSVSSDTLSAHHSHWCTLAYWELRQRVGRLYIVDRDWINIFQQLPHGYGMCLALMQAETAETRVHKARDKIGLGLVLSRETDGIWVYNRSCHPIFVNHLAVVTASRRTSRIQKLHPGCSLRIFDYSWHELLKRTRDAATGEGPSNPYCAQISFVKGWGPNYSRQTVIQCPCWIEILLHVNR